jgi:crotonobetainyl-CoA:carnitine CoA-transferase CaiB-like acyl-CoA transferase
VSTQPLPLEGVRVVDYSHFLAGPYLSRCLAALGADVIKVERPGTGDAAREHPFRVGGYSGYFMQQNMGKRGISVDIKDPRGAMLIGRLIHTADVFVENYRPGALDKLGLGYEDLSERNPGLVYCSISAYGHTGPDSAQAGFGLIAEAKSGGMSMLGEPGQAPPLYGLSLADMYTGIHGVAAVNAALIGKMKTGLGSYIDLALYDCMVSMHEYAVQQYTLSGGTVLPQQMGHDLPHSTVYGVFTGSDGYFVLAAQVDESWKRLAKLIGGERLATDPRYHSLEGRNADRAHIRELIEAWAKAQPSVRSCLDQLDAAHVPCAKIQTIDEVVNDPQIIARNMIIEQDHPALGKIRMPNLPFTFSSYDITPRRVAPTLGEHNVEVATELGFSDADIADMQLDGVLFAAHDRPDPAPTTAIHPASSRHEKGPS